MVIDISKLSHLGIEKMNPKPNSLARAIEIAGNSEIIGIHRNSNSHVEILIIQTDVDFLLVDKEMSNDPFFGFYICPSALIKAIMDN